MATDYQCIDINQVETSHARSIGAETLGLHAVRQPQLDEKLAAPGFNGIEMAAALGSLIGRIVSPGSERHTHAWLQNQSSFGAAGGRFWSDQPDAPLSRQRQTVQIPRRTIASG